LSLNGVPILVHTLRVFQKSSVISDIVLVVPQDDLSFIREQIVEKYGLTKVTAVVVGGRERQDSVRNGLAAISSACDIVVVHDAVRPLVTEEMIAHVVAAAVGDGAASLGVKAKDTIKEAGDGNLVERTLPRQNLWQTQTPQAFQYDLLCRAYEGAARDNYYGTDDASLLERIGAKVRMVAGSYENIKITTPEDVMLAEAFLKEKMEPRFVYRCGWGYDSHRFAPGRPLILGGVEIPFDLGLIGHSDADALLHAVCDALLGMAGAGDIGRHFPDTDAAYRGISSLVLLQRVKRIIEAKGVDIHHLDVTVIMEKPKLVPYVAAMTARIAEALNISEAAVNIKAKTNEGMGFVGRGEGVAVMATASGAERVTHG